MGSVYSFIHEFNDLRTCIHILYLPTYIRTCSYLLTYLINLTSGPAYLLIDLVIYPRTCAFAYVLAYESGAANNVR
jgi:hypothetical protein